MPILVLAIIVIFTIAMISIIKINKKMNTIIELMQKKPTDTKNEKEQANLLYFLII